MNTPRNPKSLVFWVLVRTENRFYQDPREVGGGPPRLDSLVEAGVEGFGHRFLGVEIGYNQRT